MDNATHTPQTAQSQPLGRRYRRYSAPLLLFTLVLAVTWLGSTGTIQVYTGWLYDALVRHAPVWRETPSRVLLIQSRTASPDPARWPGLVERLYELGARQVAFAFIPEPLDPELLEVVRSHPGMVFAREPHRNALTGDIDGLSPWPAALRDAGALPAVQLMPPDELGIRRRQQVSITLAGETLPTLPVRLAGEAADQVADTRDFLVNFLDGGRSVPIVDLAWALEDNLVRSLVEGRIIIIGFAANVREPGLHTPSTGARDTLSLLQYSAQALDTLLAGELIREASTPVRLLLYLALVALFLYLYQLLPVKTAAWLTLLAILGYVASAWLLLGLARYWMPAAEMALMQIFTFGAVFIRKVSREEQLVHHTLRHIQTRLRERVVPDSFFATDEPWIYIANLLNQTLDLNRLIFLEKVEGDHRVREVHGLNCSFEDIHEMRRDYHRTPYSTAIAANGPIRVERDYLRRVDDDEIQYLVPLTFAGEVLGFWAFGIYPERIAHEENFIALAGDFAEQIAEMLYHRQRWQEERRREQDPLERYLRIEGWDNTHRSFQEALTLLERRLSLLERVFDGMGSAAILYDLFGRVLQVNQQMEALMKQAGLRFFDMTAIDMIAAVSRRDLDSVRQYMHYTVVDRKVITLPAPALDDGRHSYMLTMRPLIQRGRNPLDPHAELAPFQLGGILIELNDISTFKALNDLQLHLIGQLNMRLRDDLEALVLAADLLPEETDGWIPQAIRDKSAHITRLFEETQKYLRFTFEDASLECWPTDALKPLRISLEGMAEIARKARVELRAELPELTGSVMAAPGRLTEVFNDVLRVLIEDASPGSNIDIRVVTRDDSVCYHFSNSGFGLPPQRLEEYLNGDLAVSVDSFRSLRAAAHHVRAWGGAFHASTELGEGMRFEICLRGVL